LSNIDLIYAVVAVWYSLLRNTSKTIKQQAEQFECYIFNFISPNGSNQEIKDNNNNDSAKEKIQ